MNPIRPNFPPPATTGPRAVRPDVRTAQRAFFEAALDRTARPATATADPVRPTVSAGRTPPDSDQAPSRYLRPGSLLDIKV